MSPYSPNDAMLPPTGVTDLRPTGLRLAVLVPIAVALAGVAVILLGGLSAGGPSATLGRPDKVDPVVTGSIQPQSVADMRHALEMLDR